MPDDLPAASPSRLGLGVPADTWEELDCSPALMSALLLRAHKHGGHITILKFTTNWRIAFGTIEWHPDLLSWRAAIEAMPVGQSFAEAAAAALALDEPPPR